MVNERVEVRVGLGQLPSNGDSLVGGVTATSWPDPCGQRGRGCNRGQVAGTAPGAVGGCSTNPAPGLDAV